jgi:hypothetical protein
MSNINDLNDKILTLACAVHGLEKGDTRALTTYEMIKKFLQDNKDLIEVEL